MEPVMVSNGYTPPEVVLTPEQKETIDNTLRLLQDIGPMIQKAQACGIECSGHEQLRQHLHSVVSEIKQHFGQVKVDPLVY